MLIYKFDNVSFILSTCTTNVTINKVQLTYITNNSDIMVYASSNVSLQCTCDNDTVQWYYNETNSSSRILTLISLKQSKKDEYTCKGQIQNIPHNINVIAYSK